MILHKNSRKIYIWHISLAKIYFTRIVFLQFCLHPLENWDWFDRFLSFEWNPQSQLSNGCKNDTNQIDFSDTNRTNGRFCTLSIQRPARTCNRWSWQTSYDVVVAKRKLFLFRLILPENLCQFLKISDSSMSMLPHSIYSLNISYHFDLIRN